MTSWGNTKQRVAFVSAAVLFLTAIYCASAGITGGALVLFVFGLVCMAGVWALGLPKSATPADDEWMDAIR